VPESLLPLTNKKIKIIFVRVFLVLQVIFIFSQIKNKQIKYHHHHQHHRKTCQTAVVKSCPPFRGTVSCSLILALACVHAVLYTEFLQMLGYMMQDKDWVLVCLFWLFFFV
jgi:amino acid permease